MPQQPIVRRVHEGSAVEDPAWDAIADLLETCVGSPVRDLSDGPGVESSLGVGWTDGDGRRFVADHLDDLRYAYEADRVRMLYVHGRIPGGLYLDFEFAPGLPRPWSRLAVEGGDEAGVNLAMAHAAALFPLPPEGGIIFLSWGGSHSLEVARSLRTILQDRYPMLEVFLPSTSIDPGDDPMRKMLDDGLLKCQVLIATLTPEAVTRPWVIWEIAAAWGREQLVIPVFIGVKSADIPGPLTWRLQGVHLQAGHGLGRILEVISRRFSMSVPGALTDAERNHVVEAAEGA